MTGGVHLPVLLEESLDLLITKRDGVYVDATLGGLGHSKAILDRLGPGGWLIGIDRDGDAIERARESFKDCNKRVSLVHGNFRKISEIVSSQGYDKVDGVMADLGVSSFQLDTRDRGFSFRADASLDMRMDRTEELTAFDLVNTLPEKELATIFRHYGEERFSRPIARAIVRARTESPIETTLALAGIIKNAMPAKAVATSRIDPATRVFQALRIAVNDELASLEEFLGGAVDVLSPGARLVVISFHSLEDRIVKNYFKELARDCVCPPKSPICVCDNVQSLKLVTRKAVKAGEAEVGRNPRARSARLRAAEKV